jgi:hypothetical protein
LTFSPEKALCKALKTNNCLAHPSIIMRVSSAYCRVEKSSVLCRGIGNLRRPNSLAYFLINRDGYFYVHILGFNFYYNKLPVAATLYTKRAYNLTNPSPKLTNFDLYIIKISLKVGGGSTEQ